MAIASVVAGCLAIALALQYKHALQALFAIDATGTAFDPVSVVVYTRPGDDPDVKYMRSGNAIMGGQWIDAELAAEPIFLNFAIQQVRERLIVCTVLLRVVRGGGKCWLFLSTGERFEATKHTDVQSIRRSVPRAGPVRAHFAWTHHH